MSGAPSSCVYDTECLKVSSGVVKSSFFFAEIIALVTDDRVFLCALCELDLEAFVIVK